MSGRRGTPSWIGACTCRTPGRRTGLRRPALHLDARSARELLDPHEMLGEVAGKVVLCLASGGGKQSAAFALLGARVSVLDLSPAQLERDRQAAAHYGVRIETVQGDMRDLSCFEPAAFDIVYQPYSLNFVPDPWHVFRQVAQVLSAGGLYRVECANPFVLGVTEDDGDGRGDPVKLPYEEGASLILEDPGWIVPDAQRPAEPLPPSQVHRHTLGRLVQGLVTEGFVILGVEEHWRPGQGFPPGSWEHFVSVAPPWLTFSATYRPDVLGGSRTGGRC